MSNPVDVMWFTSAMSGAPALSGENGKLIDLLDACLANGFGSVTLSSLVVSSGVATATVNTGHGFLDRVVVLIAGATPSGLNGEKRIARTGANTFTFDATGISNQTATGTITAKMAPLGWTKAFAGTNKAAYLPKSTYAQRYLQCLDNSPPSISNAKTARMRGYESMSDVDTGSNPFPTVAQSANGLNWIKSFTTDTTVRPWVLLGDGGIFYLFVGPQNTSTTFTRMANYAFGDVGSVIAGDSFCATLIGEPNDALPGGSWDYPQLVGLGAYNAVQDGKFLARPHNYSVGAIKHGMIGHAVYNGNMGVGGLPWPQPNGMVLATVAVCEATGGGTIRSAIMPGIRYPLHNTTAQTSPFYPLEQTSLSDGSIVMAVSGSGGGGSSPNTTILFDIIGPWR